MTRKNNTKVRIFPFLSLIFSIGFLLTATSCTTPSPQTTQDPVIMQPDVVDHTPLGSAEIMQCAQEIAEKMLLGAGLANDGGLTRIVIEPLRNKTSLQLNTGMITDELKNALADIAASNGHSSVKFISQDARIAVTGNKITKEKLEKRRDRMLEEVADGVLSSSAIVKSSKEPVIAVIPAINTNLVNMNANSFVSLLRAKIASKANGKVLFTAPGSVEKADFYLTGEFISESMKTEGMINLVDYISVMEARLKAGKSMDLLDDSPKTSIAITGSQKEYAMSAEVRMKEDNILKEIQRSSSLRNEPDVNKFLNVMLLRAADKISVYEGMFQLDKKSTSGLGNADMILSGNISSISRRVRGKEEIYIVITFVLVDAESNEEAWTGRFQTKKAVEMGGVYH